MEFLQTFLSSCFQTQRCDFLNFSICNFTVRANNKNEIQGGSNMTGTDVTRFTHKSSRSYLNHLAFTAINFSQLILAEKTKIKDSGRARPDLFLSLQKVAYKPT